MKCWPLVLVTIWIWTSLAETMVKSTYSISTPPMKEDAVVFAFILMGLLTWALWAN